MKKRNARILTALLLALCLLVGSVAALAAEVSVTAGEKDGEVKVDIKGTVEGNGGEVVRVAMPEPDEQGHVQDDNIHVNVVDDHINDQNDLLNGATSVTVNLEDINDQAIGSSTTGLNTSLRDEKSAEVNVNGDINVSLTSNSADNYIHAHGFQGGVNNGSSASIAVEGSINVKAATPGHAAGIDTMATGESSEEFVVKGAIVSTSSSGGASGLSLYANNDSTLTATVNGNITATGGEVDETVGIESMNEGGTILARVDGNVVADGKDVANGLHLNAYVAGNTTVVVKGDVTAEGRDATGLMIDEILDDASVTVLVDGTLSGSTAAIKTTDQRTERYPEQDPIVLNNSMPDVIVWQATENKDGRIAEVYQVVEPYVVNPAYQPELDPNHEGGYRDEHGDFCRQYLLDEDNATYDVDDVASAKLEQAIWYIAKVADATLTVTGTDTCAANGTTYQVAHQDEKVKLAFTLNEAEEGLDALYYNADDKTAAKADEWGKNDDGSYWVKMLRGGGMLLGLNTHKHEKATREENKVAATCTKAGSYDLVTYCTKCNKVLSTEKKTIAATGHTSGAAVKENEVAATCAKAGSYDEVVVCTVCKQELSRKAVAVDKLAHTPAEAVRENITAAKPGVPGGYDDVVYCSVCKTELSRTHVDLPALPDEEDPDEAKPAVPEVALVYEPVDENTEVNGVRVADHPEAAEALATVGEALEGETVTVSIPGAEKLMDEAEKERFDKLPVKDRLLVVLSALGFANDGLDDVGEGMSDDAKALSADITERMEALPENEKQALLNSIAAQFPKGTVTVDGKACESFSIDLVIDRDGAKTYERYTFYNDGSAWKLYGIEKGAYKEV